MNKGARVGGPFRVFLISLLALTLSACDDGGSDRAPAPPPNGAPSGLAITLTTTAQIRLAWLDGSTNEAGFIIERSDNGGATYAQIGQVGRNATAYSDVTLAASTTYFYRVAAFNVSGNSAYAGPVSGATNGLVWTNPALGGAAPADRFWHTAIYETDARRMIVFGGLDAGFNIVNDSAALNLTTLQWEVFAPGGVLPAIRFGHSAIYDALHDRMIVFGGTDDGTNLLQDVQILTLGASPTWSPATIIGTPPVNRFYHSAVYDPVNQQMIVFGGENGSGAFPDSVHVLSLPAGNTLTWTTPLTNSGPIGRRQHSAVYDTTEGKIIYFAGYDGTNTVDGSIWSIETWTLTPGATFTWQRLAPTTSPSFRGGHTAVYDEINQRMVLFSGDDNQGFGPPLNTETWSLSPETQVWTLLTPSGGPPTGRAYHTAIYDAAGGRMVIYGGDDGSVTPLPGLWMMGF